MNNEKIHRHLIAESVFETGNAWLDDCLAGGLNQENMVLVAAKTGVGKTFFGVQLAAYAAKKHKNVYYFALEAERHEIERRMLYYEILRLAKNNYPEFKMPRYREWLHLGLERDWESIEDIAQKQLNIDTATLKVKYSQRIFTPSMFRDAVSQLAHVEDKPDLIILDHLHHLFLTGDENEALKTAIHGIKAVKDEVEVPVVVLAQLRKNDAGANIKKSIPSLEDIRGTAALTDVATDVLIISRVGNEAKKDLPSSIQNPMYFHLAKSRTASEATPYVGIVGFDAKRGSYSSKYIIAKAEHGADPTLLEEHEKPHWAKNAERRAPRIKSTNYKKPYGEKDE